MFVTAIKLNTTVLPGHRIEFIAPDLPEGISVDIFVAPAPVSAETPGESRRFKDALEFLDSLPKISRSSEEWEAIEREFREDRDSWDR